MMPGGGVYKDQLTEITRTLPRADWSSRSGGPRAFEISPVLMAAAITARSARCIEYRVCAVRGGHSPRVGLPIVGVRLTCRLASPQLGGFRWPQRIRAPRRDPALDNLVAQGEPHWRKIDRGPVVGSVLGGAGEMLAYVTRRGCGPIAIRNLYGDSAEPPGRSRQKLCRRGGGARRTSAGQSPNSSGHRVEGGYEVTASYFLGIAAEQDGRKAEARRWTCDAAKGRAMRSGVQWFRCIGRGSGSPPLGDVDDAIGRRQKTE